MLSLTPAVEAADGIVFPKDAGVLNVKEHGAKGDGRHDDTAAIQAMLDAHPNEGHIIYLPNGTYSISDTLRWPHGTRGGMEERNTIVQGQSREKTILRLKDSCAGYGDSSKPKPMIWTGRAPAQRFRNAIRDLTIDAGRRNEGAIAVQFLANNQGCLRDVTIRSADGSGRVGLDLGYTDENGPCLIKRVRVIGFDFGIRAAGLVNSLTLEDIQLENQGRFGLVNEGQCLSIRKLISRNSVTALLNAERSGVVALVDANLSGMREAATRPAILNQAVMYARNITSAGYAEPIRNAANSRRPNVGRSVEEFVSHEPLLEGASGALKLDVKETPEIPWDDPKNWASPTHFGARPNDDRDDSEAIQKAIDSGKSTIYFPVGSYRVQKPITIRGAVHRIVGCEATVDLADLGESPGFRVADGSSPVVVIERLSGGDGKTTFVENASKRTLVIKDCYNVNGRMTGSGDVYLEDVCSNPYTSWRFGKQRVWARQFSVGNEGTHVVNEGGTLWILGFKTERGGTLIETKSGGKTEVVGGLVCTTTDPKAAPMFVVEDSAFSATIGEACFGGKSYTTLVRRANTDLKREGVPRRAEGSVLPLVRVR